MKRTIICALCTFSPLSLASIGIASEHYQDPERQRVIDTKVFYPTSEGQSEQVFAENPAFYGFRAVKNAELIGQNLPVYILVHGTSGNWKNLSWLGSYLAEKGALVVSANHPNYTTGQATPESVIRMWEQPRDVSFLIDRILTGNYAKHIDKQNITVVGYSLGGYTALALSGAKLDISGYQKYCSQHQDTSCDYYKSSFNGLSSEDRKMISGNYKDERVTKSVAITPGYVPAILPKSLESLSANTIIVGAEFDETIPPKSQLKPYLIENQSNVIFTEISGAAHFSFMQRCKPEATAILAEEGAAFVCKEAGNVDRQIIHQDLIKIIKQQEKRQQQGIE